MREIKLEISALRVSLPHKAAKCKATPIPERQLEFHTGKKKFKKKGRKETKIQKTSMKSPNVLAEFGWLFHPKTETERQREESGERVGRERRKSGENNWRQAGTLNITFACPRP